VGQYQGNFLRKSTVPGIEWNYNAMQQLLKQITVSDVNALIGNYLKDDNRVVVFTGPEKDGVKKPTEQEVLSILNNNMDKITAYNDIPVAASLLRKAPAAGKIEKKETNAKLGSTTLYLSNGARVTYKKTDFKNDEVLMEAVSFGGTNLFTNDDYKKTQWATGALTEAGFSGL
jgi:zinc protease